MGPVAGKQAASKRRRGGEEVRRPKKRIKNFKKQAEYHSSSDEDDAPASAGVAPRRPMPSATGANATKPTTTKPILKHAIEKTEEPPEPKKLPRDELEMHLAEEDKERDLPEEEAVPEVDDEDEDDDIEDETARNTVLNVAPAETSGSEDEDEAIGEEDNDEPALASDSSADDDEDDDGNDSDSETSAISSDPQRSKKKRNDPTAFATSISKLLDTKLTTSKRSDPVLSRSKTAAEANKTLANERLETKARAQIRHERKTMLEKGRVKDVLGLETPGVETGGIIEEEKRLKKTAQRGVVKLFNAVRAAQVKAEAAGREARREGVVGMGKREERVSEMSKQGFLDLISSGGKKGEVAA